MPLAEPTIAVIVPTFNEQDNVRELVVRLDAALSGRNAEIIFVDDSTDGTPDVVQQVAADSTAVVRLIHRPLHERHDGLGGAVVQGLRASRAEWCVVMDGDLQHPPEVVPALVDRGVAEHADVVVGSRYCAGGRAEGLATVLRRRVSTTSTLLTRFMFPRRLAGCTDPMTGFFAVRREALDLSLLVPRGFKILLEILTRHALRVVEEPFVFAERRAGQSKASFSQGLHFLIQLADLRLGRMPLFAVIGAVGAVLNLAIMAVLLELGAHYLVAALVATEITILTNFGMQDRLVFADRRDSARPRWWRLTQCLAFNNVEAAARVPVLVLLVEVVLVPGLVAQALALALAFLVRFTFVSRVVYRPRLLRAPAEPQFARPEVEAA